MDLLKNYILYPLARFTFEWLGDHLWVAGVLVLLIGILIWRFCMPVVIGFYKLFGWQGFALIALAIVSMGIFGAGWRAHRDATLNPADPEYHGNKPAPKTKKKPKYQPDVIAPSGDDFLKKLFNGNRY